MRFPDEVAMSDEKKNAATGQQSIVSTNDGEMACLIRHYNWAATPIGAMETWSPALGMMVGLLLANRFPMLLWWRPD